MKNKTVFTLLWIHGQIFLNFMLINLFVYLLHIYCLCIIYCFFYCLFNLFCLQKVWTHKRSLSDSKNNRNHISECHCHSKDIILSSPLQSLDKEQIYPRAFPSFTDDHLEKSGIANYTDLQSEFRYFFHLLNF